MLDVATSHRRRLFLKDLGMQLVRPKIECGALGNFSGIQKNIQRCILMVLGEDHVLKNTRNEETSSRKRGRCGLCVPRGDRKYSTKCDHCQKFVCAEHCTSTKTGSGHCILRCNIGVPFVDKLKLFAPDSRFFKQIIDFPTSCLEVDIQSRKGI
ncbi:hypothetical protein T11_16763 [Trichinella zimbabwensis]|uniref:PiggyBac transposable element-derived protein 4 n=1 Tax=Trichinella zimbabwensis TaxID=268475 RepID=A0A0V1GPS4_9BILA|nr:hypothetical protein T11_16763 [Trichinella zimbabwensis]